MSQETGAPKSTFISSVATVFGGQMACALLGVVMEICYARFLGPAGRGEISICLIVIGLGTLLGALGADSPIMVWAASSKMKISRWFPAVIVWGLVGSALAAALWAIIYWKFHFAALASITRPSALLILLTIPVSVFSGYFMSILSGWERFRLRAGIALADQATALGSFLLLMAVLGRKVELAILGNLVGLAVGAVAIAVLLRGAIRDSWNFPRFDREITSGLSVGLRGQPGNFAASFFYRFDVFLVSYFLGAAAVGLYALGVVISEALWQVPAAVGFALLPRTARTLDKGAAEFTCAIMRQLLIVTSFLGISIAVASSISVPFVFGEQFRPSVPVVWWLLPGAISLSLAKVACSDLTARFKTGYSTVFAFVAFGVSFALDLLLIPRMGIRGAALASSIAYFVDAVLILWALKYEMRVTWKSLLVPTLADFETYRRASLSYWTKLRSLLPAGHEISTGGTP